MDPVPAMSEWMEEWEDIMGIGMYRISYLCPVQPRMRVESYVVCKVIVGNDQRRRRRRSFGCWLAGGLDFAARGTF